MQIISFQATINLVISYDAPANAAPNPNDPQAGDATVDSGKSSSFIIIKGLQKEQVDTPSNQI